MNNKLRQLLNEYNADGYSYLIDKSRSTSLKEWKLFVEKLYADILEGKYIQIASTFENPLTKVQRYKLKKQQVPDIFLIDL